jgi:hypothetical protein
MAIKSDILLNEERKQQGITESIAREKTSQLTLKLAAEKHRTRGVGYQVKVAEINASTEHLKVGIAAEILNQTKHQLSAAKNHTAIESVNVAKSQDSLNAAKATRYLSKVLAQEQLKGLALQATQVRLTNDSTYETLKIASGKIPQLKPIRI